MEGWTSPLKKRSWPVFFAIKIPTNWTEYRGVWKRVNRPLQQPPAACINAPHLQLSPRSHVPVAYRTGMYCKFTKLDTLCLSSFHDDWAKIVTSRVFTSFFYHINIRKMRKPPPLPAMFFNQHVIKTNILTNFELDQSIIRTNLLTKFHEDRTRNVASRVFSNQMWTTDDGQRPITKAHLRNQNTHLPGRHRRPYAKQAKRRFKTPNACSTITLSEGRQHQSEIETAVGKQKRGSLKYSVPSIDQQVKASDIIADKETNMAVYSEQNKENPLNYTNRQNLNPYAVLCGANIMNINVYSGKLKRDERLIFFKADINATDINAVTDINATDINATDINTV
ncbi:hypothetical protein DPMN_154414, partial [Dreissena polymorpha]